MSQGNPTQHEIDIYCAEWILNGGDQSKAWRKAYPNSKMNDDGVWVRACNMNKNVKVQVRLKEMQADQADKDAEEFDLSASDLKGYLKQVIDMGLGKALPESLQGDDKGYISLEDKALIMSKLNLGAATSAVQEFNRMNGNHAATKSEVKVTDVTPDKRKSRIAELLGKLGGGE
jgi:hypothetical protein